LSELYDDAVRVAVVDQVDAGIDLVSDGEMRREDFILGFYHRLAPVEPIPPARRMGHSGYDQITRYRALGPITAPQSLRTVAEYTFARKVIERIGDRPVKIAIPGPLTLCTAFDLGSAYRETAELANDLAAVVNAELKAVVAAGCRIVQIDEPGFF